MSLGPEIMISDQTGKSLTKFCWTVFFVDGSFFGENWRSLSDIVFRERRTVAEMTGRPYFIMSMILSIIILFSASFLCCVRRSF